MSKLRIGVLGLGIGRLHVLALKRLKTHFDLVAVADPSPARRRQMRVLGVKGVPDLESLLALDLDVVDICTPPHLHEAQIIQCLEAGVDVVCEKPLVDSVEAVDRLAAAWAEMALSKASGPSTMASRRSSSIAVGRTGQGSVKLAWRCPSTMKFRRPASIRSCQWGRAPQRPFKATSTAASSRLRIEKPSMLVWR